jgi:hypothetical protein
MSTKTLFRWEQDPQGEDHGVLTLWPKTHREMQLRIDSFREANALGMAINSVEKDAHLEGRRSMLFEISRITP